MKRSLRILLWLLLLCYLAVLLRITVFRSDFGAHALFTNGKILWIPFVELLRILHNSLGMFLYLFVGNLIWFMPLGFLLPILTKVRSRVILWGFLLSLYIEVSQYIFGTGVSEVEDLILNTLGTALGYLCYLLCRKLKRHFSEKA